MSDTQETSGETIMRRGCTAALRALYPTAEWSVEAPQPGKTSLHCKGICRDEAESLRITLALLKKFPGSGAATHDDQNKNLRLHLEPQDAQRLIASAKDARTEMAR